MSDLRTRARKPAASVRSRRDPGARWRVASRLARRQVARTRLSSLLVVVLVALPIAGMAGFAVWSDSSLGTPAERVRVELGQTEAWVQPGGVPDAGFWQVPEQPSWNGYPVGADGAWTQPEGSPPSDPAEALPAGTRTIEIVDQARVRVDTAAGSTSVHAWLGEVWDEAFAGRYDLIDGRAPATAAEALVTPATLERVGVSLGDRLTLSDGGDAYTIVGTMDAAGYTDADAGVFLPLTDRTSQVVGDRRWYLPDLELPWSAVAELNDAGLVALSRSVVLDPPTTGLTRDQENAQSSRVGMFWSTVAIIAIGGAFAAYVVVMLAGAAFAVAARRQQRALAIVASVGATRRDLFRTVVLQGTSLGLVGGALGVALGIGGAIAVLRLTDDGSGTRPWGLHIPWGGLVAILVFAVVVGTLSALLPARGVARADAISALRGSRRPQHPRAARPIWGSILMLVGVGVTIACALVLAAVANSGIAFDSPLRWLPVWGIVAGPIVAQIGILLSGRWLLWTTSRLLSRASTAARIASRDAAANAARTVPAFAAIGATVFLGVFVSAASSMGTANSARNWYYNAPVGSLTVTAWPAADASGGAPAALTLDELTAAMEDGRTIADDSGATASALVSRQRAAWDYPDPSMAPDDGVQAVAILPEEHLVAFDDPAMMYSGGGGNAQNNLSVIEPDALGTALGVELSASDLAAYRDGAAVVSDARYVADRRIDIGAWSYADAIASRVPNNMFAPRDGDPETVPPLWTERVDAITVDAPAGAATIAIAPATAEALALEVVPERLIATFDAAPSVEERDRMLEQASLPGKPYMLNAYVETGPPSAASWLVPLLAVVSVLVVGASSVALGLARFERRPDDATLAAVGGTPGLRRRIGFWQGLLIAGFGTLAGAAAGILPAVGLSIQSPDSQRLADVPWLVLAGLAIALPLGIAAVNALVPPRTPDLTRRNVIA